MLLQSARLLMVLIATQAMGYVGKPTSGGPVNDIWVKCRHCGQKNNINTVPRDNPWDCHACGKTNNN